MTFPLYLNYLSPIPKLPFPCIPKLLCASMMYIHKYIHRCLQLTVASKPCAGCGLDRLAGQSRRLCVLTPLKGGKHVGASNLFGGPVTFQKWLQNLNLEGCVTIDAARLCSRIHTKSTRFSFAALQSYFKTKWTLIWKQDNF